MNKKSRKSNQESLGDVIDRMLDVYKLRSGLTEINIQSDWAKIAGPAIASRTDEVLLKGGNLIIRLSSPTLRQELHFQRQQILENVNTYIGKPIVTKVILK